MFATVTCIFHSYQNALLIFFLEAVAWHLRSLIKD